MHNSEASSVTMKQKRECELDGVVRFGTELSHQIAFPLDARQRSFVMDILGTKYKGKVSPGKKWQDTCISSIMISNPDLLPYATQKDLIIQMMKEIKVWGDKSGISIWEEIENCKKTIHKK